MHRLLRHVGYVIGIGSFMLIGFSDRAYAQEADLAPSDSVALEVQPDEALRQRMQAVFSNIEAFDEVTVAVNEGVVRLTGTVPGSEAREGVEELAHRFPGVIYVENQLEAASDVETRVSPVLARLRDYWQQAVENLPVFGVALMVLLFFAVIARAINRWETPSRRLGARSLAGSLVRRSLSAVLFTIGLVLALDILDVTALVGAVLGTAGVVGLAIGFAFQDIVENYLAGVLMSIRQPFNVNDLVDIGERQGKVIRMTSRELVLLTLEGNHLRLPNAMVFKSPIINYTRNPLRQFTFTVGVSNDLDLVPVMELGRKTLQAMEGVMDDPAPFVRLDALGDSNVVLRFFGWVDQREADFFKAKSEAQRLVKAAFDEANYEMPEPIYRVNLIQKGEGAPTAWKAPAPVHTPVPAVEAQARSVDAAPDKEIDKQVQEDLAASDEENLLEG